MPADHNAPGPLRASNHRIKRLRRLVTQRKARSTERAFVVEGPSLVTEALLAANDGEITVEDVFVGPGLAAELVDRAATLDVEVHVVSDGVLESILDPVTPQPVAAVVTQPTRTLADIGSEGLVLCLVEARDPGNVGTLMRSAEAAGAAGLVLAGQSVDPTNPKVVRASAGACLRLPVVAIDDVDRALDEITATGRATVATVTDSEAIPYDEVRLVAAAVMLGNEAHGLPESVVGRADVMATIPLAGPTESLNLAVAGSLFCFEALRQERAEAAAHHRPIPPNSLDTPTRKRQV